MNEPVHLQYDRAPDQILEYTMVNGRPVVHYEFHIDPHFRRTWIPARDIGEVWLNRYADEILNRSK